MMQCLPASPVDTKYATAGFDWLNAMLASHLVCPLSLKTSNK